MASNMLLKSVFFLYFCMQLSNAVLYDIYTGSEATPEQLEKFRERGVLETCTIDIAPCEESKGRRVDGSCSSVQNPTKGTFLDPPVYLLPPVYSEGLKPRKAVSGEDLPSAKELRKSLLCESNLSDEHTTQSLATWGVAILIESGSYSDTLYPIRETNNDPMRKLSKVTSTNKTTPIRYRDLGCTDVENSTPVNYGNVLFDLHYVYNMFDESDSVIRSGDGGKLILEEENGKTWPPNGENYCPNNQETETRCFANHPTVHMPINLVITWLLRQHNLFATKLAEVNPSWDDNTLFEKAREINTAFVQNVYMKWLIEVEGRDNLVKANILGEGPGFRNIFDSTIDPSVSLEFLHVMRTMFTIVDIGAKMYEPDGTIVGEVNMVDLALRPGYLPKDKNMERLTQGQFRQAGGKIDRCIDSRLASNELDFGADDIERGRGYGFAPYIDYYYHCTGVNVTSFDDLRDSVLPEDIEKLKSLYKNVANIELMTGLYAEKLQLQGYLSPTLACIINDQFIKTIKSDKYWYENEDSGFTFEQLQEIRKSSLALLLCNAGDGVTEVQQNAFQIIDENNPLVSCSEIDNINFELWADSKCTTENEEEENQQSTDEAENAN